MEKRPDTSLAQARPRRSWSSTLRRRLVRSDFSYELLSSTVTAYLRLVWATSRLTSEPTSSQAVFDRNAPMIITTWHSEAFLLPLLRAREYPVDVLVSRAGDGEIISRSLHKLGCGTVRGAGATDRSRMFEKGSVAAFRGLKASIDSGHSVVMTADFDRKSRGTVSPGIVALARLTQRPIIPAVVVTHNRFHVGSWDRSAFNLPFGRAVFIHAGPILVPRRATETEVEEKRLEVERALTDIAARAYAIADRTHG